MIFREILPWSLYTKKSPIHFEEEKNINNVWQEYNFVEKEKAAVHLWWEAFWLLTFLLFAFIWQNKQDFCSVEIIWIGGLYLVYNFDKEESNANIMCE